MAYWCRLVFCIMKTQMSVEVIAIGSMVMTMPVRRRFEHRHDDPFGLLGGGPGQHLELVELMVVSLPAADSIEPLEPPAAAAAADCDWK